MFAQSRGLHGNEDHCGGHKYHLGNVGQRVHPLLHGGFHHLNANIGNHIVRHVHMCRQAILLGVCRELGVLLNHLLNDASVALLNLLVSCSDSLKIQASSLMVQHPFIYGCFMSFFWHNLTVATCPFLILYRPAWNRVIPTHSTCSQEYES